MLSWMTCIWLFNAYRDTCVFYTRIWRYVRVLVLASVALSDMHLKGDQEVAASIPAGSGSILSWRLIMKYFLRLFFPFHLFKRGSCQLLPKKYAHVLVNHLEDDLSWKSVEVNWSAWQKVKERERERERERGGEKKMGNTWIHFTRKLEFQSCDHYQDRCDTIKLRCKMMLYYFF